MQHLYTGAMELSDGTGLITQVPLQCSDRAPGRNNLAPVLPMRAQSLRAHVP